MAVGEGAVWALSNPTSTLLRIDPARNKVVARIPMAEGDDAAAGDGAVWITHPGENTVSRVDPRTNAVSTIRVPDRPSGIAVTPGAVWVAEPDGPAVSRIDPSTNRVVATKLVAPDLLFAEHMSVGASGVAVWVAVPFGKRLVRVDARTNRVTTTVGLDFFPCGQVAVVGRFVWAAGSDCTNVVERVDPRAKGKATELTEPHAVGVVRGFGSVWVAALRTGNVERIDPRSARVVARIHVGGYPVLLGVGFGSVWVIDDKGRVIRVEPTS
jgi:streptogramin lyase